MGRQHLFHGHLALELGVGVERAVLAGLGRGGGELLQRGPPLLHQVDGPRRVEGHENRPGRILELLVHADPIGQGHPVLDAGQGLATIARPHLLHPDGQDRAGAGQAGQRGQVQGGGATGTGVVDVDDAGVAQAGLSEERLAPDAALVEQAAGGGVAEHHQIDVGRVDAGIGQGVGHHLVGHLHGRPVLPVHGGDAGADDVCGWVHAVPLILRAVGRVRRPPARPATRRSNWSIGRSAVTYTTTCSAPASRNEATTVGHLGGGAVDQVAVEGAGGDAVQRPHPLGAPPAGRYRGRRRC